MVQTCEHSLCKGLSAAKDGLPHVRLCQPLAANQLLSPAPLPTWHRAQAGGGRKDQIRAPVLETGWPRRQKADAEGFDLKGTEQKSPHHVLWVKMHIASLGEGGLQSRVLVSRFCSCTFTRASHDAVFTCA